MATDVKPNRQIRPLLGSQRDRAAFSPEKAGRSPAALMIHFFKTGFVRFLSSSGTIMLSVVLARTMTKEQFGMYSFCMVSLISLSMVARYGLDAVMLRYAGSSWHQSDSEKFRGYSFWATNLTTRNAVFFALAGLLLMWVIGSERWAKAPIMAWMLLALVPWSLVYTISFIFKSADRAPTGSMFEVGTINHLTWITVVGLTYFYSQEISAVDVAKIIPICSLLVCGVGLWMLHRSGMWPKQTEAIQDDRPEFLDACRSNTVIYIMQMLANLGGVFFLGLTWNNEEVAIFSAPIRLATATILLTTIVMLIVAPRLSGLHKSGETEKFKRTLRWGCVTVAAINVPILLTLAISAPWVMMIMPKYADHWYLLSIICIGQMIGIIAGLAPTVMIMTGNDRLWSRAVVCNSAVCVTACAVLCYFFGALGAAIGSALYQASLNWVAAVLVRKKLGYWTIPNPIQAIKDLRRIRQPAPAS